MSQKKRTSPVNKLTWDRVTWSNLRLKPPITALRLSGDSPELRRHSPRQTMWAELQLWPSESCCYSGWSSAAAAAPPAARDWTAAAAGPTPAQVPDRWVTGESQLSHLIYPTMHHWTSDALWDILGVVCRGQVDNCSSPIWESHE